MPQRNRKAIGAGITGLLLAGVASAWAEVAFDEAQRTLPDDTPEQTLAQVLGLEFEAGDLIAPAFVDEYGNRGVVKSLVAPANKPVDRDEQAGLAGITAYFEVFGLKSDGAINISAAARANPDRIVATRPANKPVNRREQAGFAGIIAYFEVFGLERDGAINISAAARANPDRIVATRPVGNVDEFVAITGPVIDMELVRRQYVARHLPANPAGLDVVN
jgi:hypothetical protein